MDPLEGADISSAYRKVITKTYVGHLVFYRKVELEKTIVPKNCADVLIASVSNRAGHWC